MDINYLSSTGYLNLFHKIYFGKRLKCFAVHVDLLKSLQKKFVQVIFTDYLDYFSEIKSKVYSKTTFPGLEKRQGPHSKNITD